MIIICPTK